MEADAAEAPPPPTAPTVRELSGEPSAAAFFAEHVERNRPLVVRGGCARWAATNWCAESLRKFGDEPVRVYGNSQLFPETYNAPKSAVSECSSDADCLGRPGYGTHP